MVLDSGATLHFVWQEENLRCTGMSDKIVALPNGQTIKATHTVDLPFANLSSEARNAHLLPQLATNSLVSIPKLADAGYTAIFHPGNKGVTIHKPNSFDIQSKKKPILQGWRDHNGLWRLNPSSNSKQTGLDKDKVPCGNHAANVYSLPSMSQSIKFLHAAAGFPVKETWLPAIEN